MKKPSAKIESFYFKRTEKNTPKEKVLDQFVRHDGNYISEVPLNAIVVEDQIRQNFEEKDIKTLAEDIKLNGLIQPIIIMHLRDEEFKFRIVAGERRYRAFKLLGKKNIPSIIKSYTSNEEELLKIQLSENIKRQDLNLFEIADSVKRLKNEFKKSLNDIAKILGKSLDTTKVYSRISNLDKKYRARCKNMGFKDVQKELTKKSVSDTLLHSKKDKKPKQLSLFFVTDNKLKLSSTTFDFSKESRGSLENKIHQMEEALKQARVLLENK